jgi:hypothetical protein
LEETIMSIEFTISIPEELVPGIIATAALEEKSPEEVVGEYAIALATKTCQDLKVGPFFCRADSAPVQR